MLNARDMQHEEVDEQDWRQNMHGNGPWPPFKYTYMCMCFVRVGGGKGSILMEN